MDALRDLRELKRISEEDESAGCGSTGKRVGKAELTGLVHHQRVELTVQLLARMEPGCSGYQVHVRVEDGVQVSGLYVIGLVLFPVLDTTEIETLLGGRLFDRVDQVVDHFVALRHD